MAYSNERLNDIYDKTDGCCHICHKKLSFSNYAIQGAKGNWEVEHSIAKANGGTEHLNNLYPACIKCNRDKGTFHTRTARWRHGNTCAPYSKARKQRINEANNTAGLLISLGLLSLIGIAIAKHNSSKNNMQ